MLFPPPPPHQQGMDNIGLLLALHGCGRWLMALVCLRCLGRVCHLLRGLVEGGSSHRRVVHLLPREVRLCVARLTVSHLRVEPGLHRDWRVLDHDEGLVSGQPVSHIGFVASDDECREMQDAGQRSVVSWNSAGQAPFPQTHSSTAPSPRSAWLLLRSPAKVSAASSKRSKELVWSRRYRIP